MPNKCFVNRCLSICSFSFGHCVVCPSSIYGFCLPLWYLQVFFIFYQHVDSNFCVTNDHFGYSHNVNHNPVLYSFMTYHCVCNKSSSTGFINEQEMNAFPKHISSPWFLMGFLLLNANFLYGVLQITVCPILWKVALTVIRRVSLVEQELVALPKHPSSSLVFRGVRVA